MSYCLNPNCSKPYNPDSNKFCQNCGNPLLPEEGDRDERSSGQGGLGRTEAMLRNVRDLLQELGEATENFARSYSDVFDDPELKASLAAFQQSHQEATTRLENPTLSIATVGTTSSGKSTIVNALLGRRIAPIEAGEMSGGVLTLHHAEECKLVVEETEGAVWETGEWTGLSDEELYNRIRTVMFSYHEKRKTTKSYVAPQLIASLPLFPASNPTILGLPAGVGLEYIDLPGLKSIQDKDNLKIVQERVHKAFSLVALDYGQVDEQHRQRLLEELKKVVQYLQGRTDSMIFILNRVDLRGADDIPVEERIEKLRAEIQEVLSLKEPPDILPFNARLLYYAQCAWGSGSLNEASQVAPAARLKLLEAMFQDCAGTIQQYTRSDRALRNQWRDLEDKIHDLMEISTPELGGQGIDDNTMRQVLRDAIEWSGGKQLWDCMRSRVRNSLPELVILPALIEVFGNFDSLIAKIDALVEIRKMSRKEEVEAERKRIQESAEHLREEVEETRNDFRARTQEIIDNLKQGLTRSKAEQIAEQIAEQFGMKAEICEPLISAVDEVQKDLNLKLIGVVKDFFKNDTGAYELEDKLKEVIQPILANDLARAYDQVRGKLEGFTHKDKDKDKDGYFVKSVREDDKNALDKLKKTERAFRQLYQAMRDALSSRAEFVLQGQAQQFEEALQKLAEYEAELLGQNLEREFSTLKIAPAILSEFNTQVSLNPPTLPETFFLFEDKIHGKQTEKREKVGTQKVTETYKEGFWIWEKEKTRYKDEPVYGQVKYRELSLPDFDKMTTQWREGIAKGESRLWDNLSVWMIEYLELIGKQFDNSVKTILDFADRALEQQLEVIEQNLEAETQFWIKVDEEKTVVVEIQQRLQNELRSEKRRKTDGIIC